MNYYLVVQPVGCYYPRLRSVSRENYKCRWIIYAYAATR